MSWLGSRTTKVIHPDGKFDINAIVDLMAKAEEYRQEVTAIVLTEVQYYQLRADNSRYASINTNNDTQETCRLFGAEVEICNTPGWCIAIAMEF